LIRPAIPVVSIVSPNRLVPIPLINNTRIVKFYVSRRLEIDMLKTICFVENTEYLL
jgi:hypothetical protein